MNSSDIINSFRHSLGDSGFSKLYLSVSVCVSVCPNFKACISITKDRILMKLDGNWSTGDLIMTSFLFFFLQRDKIVQQREMISISTAILSYRSRNKICLSITCACLQVDIINKEWYVTKGLGYGFKIILRLQTKLVQNRPISIFSYNLRKNVSISTDLMLHLWNWSKL